MQANPFDQFDGPIMGPPVIPEQPDPIAQENLRLRQTAEARQAEAQNRSADLAERKFDYQQQRDAAKAGGAGGKAADTKTQQRLANLDSLTQQINRVQELYDNNLKDEAFGILSSLAEFLPTATNRQFDSAAAGLAEQGLASFRVPGVGAQSDTELRQFVEANKPSASDYDTQIEEKLRQLRTRVDATRTQMGLEPAQWGGQQQLAPATPMQDGTAQTYAAATDTKTVQDSGMAALEGEYRNRLASGQSAGEIIPWLRSQGVGPETLKQAVQQIQYRRANPNVPIDNYSITSGREVPLSPFEQAATAIGDSPVGAGIIGGAQFLSGNTLDNMASDPEGARLAMEINRASHPTATTVGEIGGGIMAALTGEAGLARLGMASGIGRAVLADGAMGAANGAGAADDGSRGMGAVQGGLAAATGSLAGAGVMRGASKALNPTGGRLADLYASGVRPTPGQRFAESGTVGGLLNAAEEHLQSVPVVGTAIRGARQEARDQFQVGAFNQALKEIGDELPAGMKPGTDPHKYAQQAFNRIYDEARSGMRVVADEQLANDLTELAPDIETLGPQAHNKLKAIMASTLRKDLEGDGYKTAMSDLGKHIARLRKSTMGEEQQLADVLTGVERSLDSAARRHSDPEAVKLLDAADAGYAKLVRIEEASSRRGGEPGTFSPNNFDSAVQKSSGGVRSKAYLRGDALMEDYAAQGKTLSDRVPNSGTPERQMTGLVATGGLGMVSPSVLAALGGLGALYAPGVRKATKGAFAPSAGKRKAIANQLKKIERLTSVSTGAAGAQASIPSQ